MDIVRNPKIDWLGKKWYFIGVSAFFGLLSALSLLVGEGLNLGVDFTGGTLVYVKFMEAPDLKRIRSTLGRADLGAQEVTRFDEPSANEVQIRMARVETAEAEDLGAKSQAVFDALRAEFGDEAHDPQGLDLNNVSSHGLSSWLQERDPEGLQSNLSISEFEEHYSALAARVADHRTSQSGIIADYSDLDGLGLPDSVLSALREDSILGSFTVISVESVGPKVGNELRERAQSAIFFSLLGMLIYIAFRFRPIYGVAAIIALFHDVFLTLGFFSVSGKEISLTVLAALLTLVGYSINDTIVVFDRVRENLKLMRREKISVIINTSINQTLNRTIMTSGMTFLAVFALYMLGGEALSGFALALVAGIIVGTYSSVAIASPIVLWWQNFSEKRKLKARA